MAWGADGSLPIVGVNTFLPREGEEEAPGELELIHSSEAEKRAQIDSVGAFQERHAEDTGKALERLQAVARSRGNVFEELVECVKVASLGQISGALYEVGGSIGGVCSSAPPAPH